MKRFSNNVLFVALLAPVMLHGFVFTPSTFYAINPFSEPRYTRNGLTTLDVQLAGGYTSHAYNGSKDSVDLLRIYGDHDIAELGIGAISNPASSDYNALLADLYASGFDESGTGTLAYAGKFDQFQGNIYLAQNIAHGFFLDLVIPFKRLQIKNVSFTDLSTGPDAESLTWLSVRNNLTGILGQYDLDASGYKKTGVGDILLSAGWSYSKTDSDVLDFFDTTLKFSISVPTADKKDEDNAFAVPLGYDGHVAFPINFDASLGFFDWLTVGAHVDGVFFASKSKVMRLNTNPNQTGFFKLLKGEAKRSMGPQVDVSAYVKADHIFHGLSLLTGYNFIYKGHDTLTPVDLTLFNSAIVNVDPTLKAFYSHGIMAGLEYDFADEGKKFNPHVSVFYTRPVAGKRVFKTNNFGGTLGLHVAWDF
jgi:hypothetical protein